MYAATHPKLPQALKRRLLSTSLDSLHVTTLLNINFQSINQVWNHQIHPFFARRSLVLNAKMQINLPTPPRRVHCTQVFNPTSFLRPTHPARTVEPQPERDSHLTSHMTLGKHPLLFPVPFLPAQTIQARKRWVQLSHIPQHHNALLLPHRSDAIFIFAPSLEYMICTKS